jgi:anaerobic selenocysteine-containing dehydrogenase
MQTRSILQGSAGHTAVRIWPEPSLRASYAARMNAPALRSVIGVCPHDCPDSCGWVVTVEDRPSGPVPVKMRGNPDHPYSLGELCPKVNRYLDRVLSPDRILTPLRRTGPKGSGQFEPISWDAALSEIAAKWQAIISTSGPEALVSFRSAGNQSALSMEFPERLLAALGTSRLVGSVCGATAHAVQLTYGTAETDDPMEIRHAKVILLWGTNTKMTNRHLWPFIEEAKANGATVVVIDPIRTMTAEAADQFIQPLPGTDVALMLAMMHVLIRDGHTDIHYISAHTTGFDELVEHVKDWTPARAADICGITADEIESLALLYATGGPAFIRTIIGAEHAEHGATFFRTLAMLPLLIGAWKHRGGGISRSVGTYAGNLTTLERPELAAGKKRRPLHMIELGAWLNDTALNPKVESIIVWGANPLVTIPDTEAIRRGFLRDDLFTIVHEQFMTDTAAYADIIVPATTQIEQIDVTPSWGSPHVTYNNPAIGPMGEAVSNTELFRRLATALGLTDPQLHTSDDDLVNELFAAPGPRLKGATADRLRAEGTIRIDVEPQRFARGGFGTKDGKARFTSSATEALGMGRLPQWLAPNEGAHGTGEVNERFPFIALTPKAHTRFLNSSYSNLPGHGDREGAPYLELCAADAAALSLADGDQATVFNDRGSVTVAVRITNRVRPGLVTVPFGWTTAGHGGGGVANSLTSAKLTNWGGGVSYNDTRVGIRKA